MAVTIAVKGLLQDEVKALIRDLNNVLNALSPPEVRFQMTPEDMAQADTTVFIGCEDGRAVACGALRRHEDGVAEVKRMYTLPTHRGRGIGGRILTEIERLARREEFARPVLQTGDRMAAAARVYGAGGFRVSSSSGLSRFAVLAVFREASGRARGSP